MVLASVASVNRSIATHSASLVLGLVLTWTTLAAQAHEGTPPCPGGYWVAPDGNDTAAGDQPHPFATLERARDALRANVAAGRREICARVVTLRGGQYRRTTPFVLEARDSGTWRNPNVYRAAADEIPVISGSIPVTGWTLHDAPAGIWRAKLGPLFIGPQRTRQLYVNGKRAVRAQSEPDPNHFERTDIGYRFLAAAPGETLPAWGNPAAIEAVTLPQWKMMRCPVEKIVGPDIVVQGECWRNANLVIASGGPSPWNFRELAWLENAYEFLDRPGEWYLDNTTGTLYYLPRPGEDMATASVELPLLETLVDVRGELGRPVHDLRLEGLTFAYATWLQPGTPAGYAADQSGFHLVGPDHHPNAIGHDPDDARTPGNVRLIYAQHVEFHDNTFTHLGAVGLDFDTGSQFNVIANNVFEDISSAAVQVGGITRADHHPEFADQVTRDNLITNNLVRFTGREYWDAAGIYIGFTTRSTVSHNDISDVPWSGIAIGWGWGLLDQGAFPGLPGATQGMWGQWDTPSTSRGNRIVHNRIRRFLGELWDGGAIYTQGRQGNSLFDGELIAWNVISDKRAEAGGNSIYTDGGSQYVTLLENVAYANPQGVTDFGPCGLPAALPWCAVGIAPPEPGAVDRCSSLPLCWLRAPYGGDIGGCVPHGDIGFVRNYWSSSTFQTVCPRDLTRNLMYFQNQIITGAAQAPAWILRRAGRQAK